MLHRESISAAVKHVSLGIDEEPDDKSKGAVEINAEQALGVLTI